MTAKLTANAARDTARAAQTALLVHRAVLRIKDVTYIWRSFGTAIEITVWLENTGDTDAHILQSFIELGINQHEIPDPLTAEGQPRDSQKHLSRGQKGRLVYWKQGPQSPVPCLVFGYVTYDNLIGEKRRITFSFSGYLQPRDDETRLVPQVGERLFVDERILQDG